MVQVELDSGNRFAIECVNQHFVLVFQANENIIIQSASESYLMRSFFKV
jgi:hypothetical protein